MSGRVIFFDNEFNVLATGNCDKRRSIKDLMDNIPYDFSQTIRRIEPVYIQFDARHKLTVTIHQIDGRWQIFSCNPTKGE